MKLEAEDTAIEVAYKAAEAGIDAAKGLTNAALDAIDFAAKAVSEILNIEEIWISAGSLAKVKYVLRRFRARWCVGVSTHHSIAIVCSGMELSWTSVSRASSWAITLTGS